MCEYSTFSVIYLDVDSAHDYNYSIRAFKARLILKEDSFPIKNKKGFTLIELIVVLAILAIIAAIAVPTAFGSIEKARNAADSASIEAYNSAIRMQAALIQADPALTGNTVAEALAAAQITTQKVQSKNVKVTFNPANGTNVASFSIYFDGTTGTDALAKGADFSTLTTVTSADTTASDKKAGTSRCIESN